MSATYDDEYEDDEFYEDSDEDYDEEFNDLAYTDDQDVDLEECPHCGEEVYEDSVQCPYCGEYIENFNRGIWAHRPLWWKVLGLLGIVMVILAFSGPLLRLILNLN